MVVDRPRVLVVQAGERRTVPCPYARTQRLFWFCMPHTRYSLRTRTSSCGLRHTRPGRGFSTADLSPPAHHSTGVLPRSRPSCRGSCSTPVPTACPQEWKAAVNQGVIRPCDHPGTCHLPTSVPYGPPKRPSQAENASSILVTRSTPSPRAMRWTPLLMVRTPVLVVLSMTALAAVPTPDANHERELAQLDDQGHRLLRSVNVDEPGAGL